MTERSSNKAGCGYASVGEERRREIEESICAIRAGMEQARKKRGEGGDVTLLAATKTVPADEINYATQVCGITDIGENRVQELVEKYDHLDKEGVRIHFIGQLQTNKVRAIIDKVDLIHSVDSERLAREIDKRAAMCGRVMDVLIEVNIGREENKGGILPEQVAEFADLLDTLPSIRLMGIMTIAPICEEIEEQKKFFEETSLIYLDNFVKKRHNREGTILSMGMSDSYPQAILCGSSLIRVGSALFGARPKKA